MSTDAIAEFLEPYRALERAVSPWVHCCYEPAHYPEFDVDADGNPCQLSAEQRAVRTRQIEDELYAAYNELFVWTNSFLEREMKRMIKSGEAADVADAIMIGTTETQLKRDGLL